MIQCQLHGSMTLSVLLKAVVTGIILYSLHISGIAYSCLRVWWYFDILSITGPELFHFRTLQIPLYYLLLRMQKLLHCFYSLVDCIFFLIGLLSINTHKSVFLVQRAPLNTKNLHAIVKLLFPLWYLTGICILNGSQT